MKKKIHKNKMIMESTLSIIGLMLAYIKLGHNLHLLDVILPLNDSEVVFFKDINISYVDLLKLFISSIHKKAIIYYCQKYFCMPVWYDSIFFLGCTNYTNMIFNNPTFYNVGTVIIKEIIVSVLKKRSTGNQMKFLTFKIHYLITNSCLFFINSSLNLKKMKKLISNIKNGITIYTTFMLERKSKLSINELIEKPKEVFVNFSEIVAVSTTGLPSNWIEVTTICGDTYYEDKSIVDFIEIVKNSSEFVFQKIKNGLAININHLRFKSNLALVELINGKVYKVSPRFKGKLKEAILKVWIS